MSIFPKNKKTQNAIIPVDLANRQKPYGLLLVNDLKKSPSFMIKFREGFLNFLAVNFVKTRRHGF